MEHGIDDAGGSLFLHSLRRLKWAFGWIVPPGDGDKAVNVWTSGLDPKNLLSVLHDLVILEHGKTKYLHLFLPSSVI